jgi:hypothetical protein
MSRRSFGLATLVIVWFTVPVLPRGIVVAANAAGCRLPHHQRPSVRRSHGS